VEYFIQQIHIGKNRFTWIYIISLLVFFLEEKIIITFHWEFDQQICSHLQETNLNIVNHIRIGSKKATNNCVNYFPNVTQLTMDFFLKRLIFMIFLFNKSSN